MSTTPDTSERQHLPFFKPRSTFEAALDVRQQTAPYPQVDRLRAPDGAPNVLVILIDDMGFGASSAFGGPCRMPVAEQLADNGLRYSRFHTTALCSPTRAALMTGRNHHSVGMGQVTDISTPVPGYDGLRGPDAGTLAQTLNLNGYATGAFGKWHQTPAWEQTAAGPFDRWPTNEGFEKFYGILAGETNQFTPTLVDGTTFLEPPFEEDGYHLSEALADEVTSWINQVRTFDKEKPWFTYLSFGATHAPFHLPDEWREKELYRGEFSHGWDEQRERTLARQKELGVVSEDAELAPWRGGAPHWDELSDVQKIAAERLMETYAAFAEHTDAQVGKVVDYLRETGELENTLIFYILGDNGASAEGGIDGTLNEGVTFNGVADTADRIVEHLDEIGGPTTYPHYNVGWALAMDTPYQWAKQIASHYGGTRNGLIVHWPEGTPTAGEVRNQWHHVIDVAPTILEAAGIPQPETINGIEQRPIEGTSLLYSLTDASAAERHTTQYFEMFGNRGIYHEGWTAVAQHRIPWLLGSVLELSFDDDVWELYDTTTDWSQARDLAAEHPEKLAELKELFLVEARKHNVLPLDDRGIERANAVLAGRPRLAAAELAVLTTRDGFQREDNVPSFKSTSYVVSADIETDAADNAADGVLVAQGGRFGGWSLFLVDGRPAHTYNFAALESTTIVADTALAPGRHTIEYQFDYDGGGLGKGGTGTLLVNGTPVASGRLERTSAFMFSADETLNVGVDRGSPVSDRYSRGRGNPFTGTVHTVTLATAEGLLPSPEERLEAALVIH